MILRSSPFLHLAGLSLYGDIADLTTWLNLHVRPRRLVAFAKAPPKTPPSPAQVSQRNRWRAALAAWRALPPKDRSLWNQATRLARCRCSGLNLFIAWQSRQPIAEIRTIERQSGIQLIAQTPTPP